MLEAIRLWFERWRLEDARPEEELDEATRAVSVAIIQTLSNRAYRRPELDAGNPLESARDQRRFDEETVRTYLNNIRPELEPVRTGFLARGQWSQSQERLAFKPTGVDDLRSLAIELERLRADLGDE